MIYLSLFEIILMSLGVSADATTVSICKGLKIKNHRLKKGIIIALYFGSFQMILPILGFYIGENFNKIINQIDHWLVFSILAYVGVKMIIDALKNNKELDDSINYKEMIMLAIATSIDAFSIGVSIAFLKTSIFLPSVLFFVFTFLLSLIGVYIGNLFGDKWAKSSSVCGGSILIFIGIRILLSHLGII